MIAWFARNDVAANLLLLTILALGLGSLHFSIPLEVFPSIEPRSVRVTIAIPGAMPEDVETSVSIKLEEAVQDLEGIEDVVSNASEGQSLLIITLDDNYDPQTLLTEIKNRIDAVNNLPADAERPVVSLSKRKREVISVAVSGDLSEREIRQQAQHVRDQLLDIEGITQVELDGVRDYEISIEVNERVLQKYGLSLSQVALAIQQHSRDISAGSLKSNGGEILIRSSGQAYNKLEFEQIPVLSRADGSSVTVADLASVNDGFEESAILTRFNGRPAALVDVYRVGQQSAIDVADKVRAYLQEAESSLPESVQLDAWHDRSKIVKKRLKTLSDNAIQGGILVLLLLTLFLRPAIAFWVCIGIPVSFMGALLVMPLFDITINVISLFGFIVILGIVVDDAIVTGENIYSHLRRSESGLEAAINGTKEVAVPVTFGILTTIAAFLPIAFIEGVRGQLFAAIPVVVIPILVFSLIESKLVLPAHLKRIKLQPQNQSSALVAGLSRFQQRFADGFESVVLHYYQPALQLALKYRYLCLALSFGLLFILYALVSTGWMKFIFFPKVQSELARANLEMPIGTPVEVTDRYVLSMLGAARELQDKYHLEGEAVIRNIMATTGSSGGSSHIGRVIFEITPPEERTLDITSRELVNEWRALIGHVPGAEKLTYRAEIGRVSDPIDIKLSAQDFNALSGIAELIKEKLASYPGVFDISDSYSDGKEAIEIVLLPQASVLGLTRQDIMSQVREAFYGYEVQRIQRGRDDIRVVVRYPKSDRQSIRSLEEFLIRNAQGSAVPLSQVASLRAESTPAVISRLNLKRTISVRADVDKQATNMLVLQQELRDYIDRQLGQFPGVSYSMEGEAKEQRQSFGSLKWGVLFVLFIIYSLLAIPFKSYLQPVVVMAVIPFGAIGAIAGHWIIGMDLTLISLLGMLALTGIVVNDSLVLVDFVNKRRKEGRDLLLTVSGAAAARFRPVILTSLTTFFGLMPLLFEQSTQAQFLIPMAVSLGFGIVFATLITLVLVPVNYLVIADIQRLFRKQALSD
ncbi:acriflavine resistance protein B [Oleiphilus sp. HI0085]|uniref:efflux RND transporter permease subunit n=3 Tax=Oleiphilus TaxID=141450 RepID=UPI0007C39D0A|nr:MULTISPECIES: efflux RND transporter permease subunit [unclassified Oleiphilus]KZY65017.1 acriflavine resistance protein B [Oleiphilus sp. HI0061]KZY78826.1 acriflavine resistance protein B [Oleiphilus sp. HI0069]KZZ31170.1 acriflavine resistance protein B [Oleiphilus sp. HI0085]KZZ78583.1 acriflavine resistance protein B [Oleiphilus sp. HI0132]